MTPVMEKIVQPVLGEFFGTFFLTFVGICVGCSGQTTADTGPVSTGLTVALVIMALGPVSGAHINPCVSLAFAIIGELKMVLCFCYFAAQLLGAAIAGVVARFLLPGESYSSGNGGMVLIPADSGATQAIGAEVVATFFLIYVVLHTAADQNGSLAPVAIGFVVIVNIYAVGGISGCCMNPARALGATIAATGEEFPSTNEVSILSRSWMDNLWYLIGTLFGTILAGLVYRFLTAKNPKYSIRCDSLRRRSSNGHQTQIETGPSGFSESTDPC